MNTEGKVIISLKDFKELEWIEKKYQEFKDSIKNCIVLDESEYEKACQEISQKDPCFFDDDEKSEELYRNTCKFVVDINKLIKTIKDHNLFDEIYDAYYFTLPIYVMDKKGETYKW